MRQQLAVDLASTKSMTGNMLCPNCVGLRIPVANLALTFGFRCYTIRRFRRGWASGKFEPSLAQ
jgi:hypothetical protein